jgi:polysaccharide export outer membrane protein
MFPTPSRPSSAAVLLLAFVVALPGQNLHDDIEPARLPALTSSGPQDKLPEPAEPPGSQAEAYLLGPGDVLSIRVLEAEDSFRDPIRISTTGEVHLPMAGRLRAAGLTVVELEAGLTERLKTYLYDPHVALNVTEYRSRPVTVLGAVQRPGVQILSGEKTLLEVLSEAGGIGPEAGPNVRITRLLAWGPLPLPNARPDASGQFSIAEVRLKEVLSGDSAAENLLIRPQDVISVPRAEMIYVVGAVRQASGFVLEQRDSLSVLEVLSLAGGLAPKAAPRRAAILRAGEEGAGARLQVAVNLKGILEGREADLALGSGDVLFVPYSGAKIAAEKAVNAAITIGTGLLIWRR